MIKKYELLEHPSDLKIKAFGETKEELFSNALFGMEECLKPETREGTIEREVKISSVDLSGLMVDFLSEALYLTQVNKEAYFEARFSKLTDKELEGRIIGKKAERFGEDIKAVTYYDLDVKQKDDGSWEAVVLFDI